MLTLPVSLRPIRHARTFVLVSDHHQLSPLVMSQQARYGTGAGLQGMVLVLVSSRICVMIWRIIE